MHVFAIKVHTSLLYEPQATMAEREEFDPSKADLVETELELAPASSKESEAAMSKLELASASTNGDVEVKLELASASTNGDVESKLELASASTNGDVESKLELASAGSKGGEVVFRYRLPDDDLALRSVCISNGVPILRFGASPKVPTITEEDVATIFRLVSEGTRPEFFYRFFPSTHPMRHCRFFMQYSPAWLRWTAVGKLLAEADWTMKCLHVGTRANKEKTTFKSWSAESQLDGLASRLDFPKDGVGPIMMTCDHVTVQKDEDEIVFPEEPKMNITDGRSSVYSKYITEIYQVLHIMMSLSFSKCRN